MKKQLLLIGVALISIYMTSCNGNGDQKPVGSDTVKITSLDDEMSYNFNSFDTTKLKDEDFCLFSGGSRRFIIEEADARPMLARFDNIYKTDDLGHTVNALLNNYWIDSCTVFRIASYLRSQQYDGVRVYFACEEQENTGAYPGEQYKNKSSIFIYPTQTLAAPPPAGQSEHVDVDVVIPTTGCSIPTGYFETKAAASGKLSSFKTVYRKTGAGGIALKDSLSISVWVDSCVVFALEKFIKDNSAKRIDGANIKMAAYETKDLVLRPSQKHHKQSTFIIVPTNPNTTGGHDDNWTIIKSFYKFIRAYRPAGAPGGMNHGELCPQVCN